MTAIIDNPLTDCKECTNPVAPWDRFCNSCGVKTDLGFATDSVAALETGDTDPIGFAPIAAPPSPPVVTNVATRPWYAGRGAKLTAIALASAIAAGLVGFAASNYVENRATQERIDATISAANQGLTQASAELGTVATTEQIRSIATTAGQTGNTLAEGTGDLEGDNAARANSVQTALTALAGLSALNTDTLDQWPALRDTLKPALDAVNTGGEALGVPGSDASLATIDALVTRGNQAIAKWNTKNAAIAQKKADDLAALDSYSNNMNTYLNQYSTMRSDTGGQLDKMREAGYYNSSTARSMFDAARADRQRVRDAINGLATPKGLESPQSYVTDVISDGMAGMSALIGAIDANAATCAVTSCNLLEHDSWEDFQTTSERVTKESASAEDQVKTAINDRRQAIKDRPMPGKPVV